MNFLWATGTHRGRVRTSNQDAVHPAGAGRSEEGALLIVADGMGGHVAGEVASGLAVESAQEAGPTAEDRVRAGNAAIMEEIQRRPGLAGMGTTMTVAAVDADGTAHLAHVGDSRAYLLRRGFLRQLTTDHSLVAEYLAAGKIRPEDVATHPHRSMLTRALGLEAELEIDVHREPLQPGDRLLLCSDGLSSMVDDEHIHRLLAEGTPEEAVWALIEAANRAGGHDNISVAILDVAP